MAGKMYLLFSLYSTLQVSSCPVNAPSKMCTAARTMESWVRVPLGARLYGRVYLFCVVLRWADPSVEGLLRHGQDSWFKELQIPTHHTVASVRGKEEYSLRGHNFQGTTKTEWTEQDLPNRNRRNPPSETARVEWSGHYIISVGYSHKSRCTDSQCD